MNPDGVTPMSMNLSINPTYYCNFRCDFCYLTPEQLGDRQQITLSVLDQRLSEVPEINHIDLYGVKSVCFDQIISIL